MRRLAVLLTITLAVPLCGAALSGCARVKPYQRDIHSKRVMKPDPDKVEVKLDSHVEEYREGSTGGAGVGGGGCGCN